MKTVLSVSRNLHIDLLLKRAYLTKIPIESFRKKSEYSVYVYGALDNRLFQNKRLNVDFKKY